ncbi:DUF1786 family protein [Desulfovibrio sp. OttesenSCG-928-M14]|nr:DUF1786 family protein [Desulfovibrio sp. OttesenSCG-928-M14]
MLAPYFAHISAPVLAVDLGIFTMRALLYVPGKGPQEQYGFLLPSPECTLNERIHNCTVNRRPLYMIGVCMGLTPIAALRTHLAAGLEVAMHPDTAAAMTDTPGKIEALGIKVQRKIPANASHVQAMDFDSYFWNTLCDMAELPRPEITLVSAADYGHPLDYDTERGRSELLTNFFQGWTEPRDLTVRLMPGPAYRKNLLRLSAIEAHTGVPSVDFATAFLFGMLALPEIDKLSRQRTVLLLHVGERFMEAFIVYDNKLYAFLELPYRGLFSDSGLESHDGDLLLQLLHEYYAGSLSADKITQMGGCLWRANQAPPGGPEICPIFASGAQAFIMERWSRIIGMQLDSVIINCWGLLNVYNRYLSHGQS